MSNLLRYPGGKTRAVKYIKDYIPQGIEKLCSPFFGGGSLEFFIMRDRGIPVDAHDIFKPLYWFWKALLEEKTELVYTTDSFRLYHDEFIHKTKSDSVAVRGLWKEVFKSLQKELRGAKEYSVRNAAIFYALNRSSFSGETLSGGYSKKAGYARFTDSSIDRLKEFDEPNLTVGEKCFTESIPESSDSFLYCDPPYMLEKGKDKLYGDKGSTHKGFDHEGLYEVLDSHPAWTLSYNNCDKIKKMYSKHKIVELDWAYGMKNTTKSKDNTKVKMGKSSEILIIKE